MFSHLLGCWYNFFLKAWNWNLIFKNNQYLSENLVLVALLWWKKYLILLVTRFFFWYVVSVLVTTGGVKERKEWANLVFGRTLLPSHFWAWYKQNLLFQFGSILKKMGQISILSIFALGNTYDSDLAQFLEDGEACWNWVTFNWSSPALAPPPFFYRRPWVRFGVLLILNFYTRNFDVVMIHFSLHKHQ